MLKLTGSLRFGLSLGVMIWGPLGVSTVVSGPPRVIATVPEIGASEVDPVLQEIRVTFDRDMGGGMSWTGEGEVFPPKPENAQPRWVDKRTCVLPVQLKAGRFYRVGINSPDFQNFKSEAGDPAAPKVLYFATQGATEEILARMEKPMVILFDPDTGTDDVRPGPAELRVTFDVPMASGMSWVGGGEHFPRVPEGTSPRWSEDGRTCILPVVLEPERIYRLNLNGIMHNNFQSSWGIPLDPVDYSFRTAP